MEVSFRILYLDGITISATTGTRWRYPCSSTRYSGWNRSALLSSYIYTTMCSCIRTPLAGSIVRGNRSMQITGQHFYRISSYFNTRQLLSSFRILVAGCVISIFVATLTTRTKLFFKWISLTKDLGNVTTKYFSGQSANRFNYWGYCTVKALCHGFCSSTDLVE